MLRLPAKARSLKRVSIVNLAGCVPGMVVNHTYATIPGEAGGGIVRASWMDVVGRTKMIKEYVQRRMLKDALQVFDEMPQRDAVSWNLTIKGCLDCGELDAAVRLFDEMPGKNIVSRTTMMNGYLRFGRLEMAEEVFRQIPHKDTAAWNSMINGYFDNGRVDDGVKLFEEMPMRDAISWTSVISGLERHGRNSEALACFKKMMSFHLVASASATLCSALKACASCDLSLGFQVHACVVKLGYASDPYSSASLITFYANGKDMRHACRAFDESLDKNVVVRTALLTGYGSNGEHHDALEVFRSMVQMGVAPNQSSFTSALNSCSELESHDKGLIIHAAAVKLGFEADTFVSNSLIVMYSKCGHVGCAVRTFGAIEARNLVSWNSIIVSLAQHGFGLWSFAFFSRMMRAGVEPDEITFTGLMCACSHSGMLRKGRLVFRYFSELGSVAVSLEHCSLMASVLARCGEFDEAERFILTMPLEPNAAVWLSLLSACCAHQSGVKVAERAADQIFKLDPLYAATYTLLSNLYALADRWSDVARIRNLMRQKSVTKPPGCSWQLGSPQGGKAQLHLVRQVPSDDRSDISKAGLPTREVCVELEE
uniref:Pentatricopeptide repeat-containing protein n=1 Tax=Kalanchoe fedtschenkoi TaxID=63787 RepID=A0A7N0U3N9_KALFE